MANETKNSASESKNIFPGNIGDDAPGQQRSSWKDFLKTRKGKITVGVVVFLVFVGVAMAVPVSRYALAGTVVKKQITISVVDADLNKPVSGAAVTIAGDKEITDAKGKITYPDIPAGKHEVIVEKKYFDIQKTEAIIPIFSDPSGVTVNLRPTGRQVTIKVINAISKDPLEKATVSISDTNATTDQNGEALLVLPPDKDKLKGNVVLKGHNRSEVTVDTTAQTIDKNTFTLTPEGKIYFLSKRTGKIDVMKSNLDGSNPEVVLTGTGKENDFTTVLLASRDWRYLILKSEREGTEKLYEINTSTDKLRVVDEGDARFDPVGWHGDHFIYTVYRQDRPDWKPGKQVIKSYNAKHKSYAVLAGNGAAGDSENYYVSETIGKPYILNNEIVYTKNWYDYNNIPILMEDKKNRIMSVAPHGADKKTVFSTKPTTYISDGRVYKPGEIYFEVANNPNGKNSYYEYHNGELNEARDITQNIFYQFYPTYLLSPGGENTFWSSPRDGKNTLFLGNKQGGQAKKILDASDYVPYGWYSDQYLLASKEGSELYILPRDASNSVKITNYHKPRVDFSGYGHGYGGF